MKIGRRREQITGAARVGKHSKIEPTLRYQYSPERTWFVTLAVLAVLSGLMFIAAMQAGHAGDWGWMSLFIVLLVGAQSLYWVTTVELVRFWLERPVARDVYEPVGYSYDDDGYDHHPRDR